MHSPRGIGRIAATLTVAATLLLAVGCTSRPSDQTITFAEQGYFFVGRQYTQTVDG
jgi:hypothetical protein